MDRFALTITLNLELARYNVLFTQLQDKPMRRITCCKDYVQHLFLTSLTD